jgi:hypothetical protein
MTAHLLIQVIVINEMSLQRIRIAAPSSSEVKERNTNGRHGKWEDLFFTVNAGPKHCRSTLGKEPAVTIQSRCIYKPNIPSKVSRTSRTS